jgi:D-xylose 1-dehydrogenase (NADP+, D-xylono-1,5-lactone-forming)
MNSSRKVRWGILGAGRIAARLMSGAELATSATVVAVASRDRDRAAKFASRFGIARVYGSYEALLADPEVEAVYISVPNSLHHPLTMQSLAAGKHVLCEKPYTRHPDEVVAAFDAAESAGLILMEAFMWRHMPQTRRLVELLPEVGEVQSIRASFSFVMTEPENETRLEVGFDGGSLMDVGCYCVSGSRLIAGTEPSRVYGAQTLTPSGVDLTFSGMLTFPSGLVAEIVSSFASEHKSLEVFGGKGNIVVPDPWLAEPSLIRLGEREIAVESDDPYRLELDDMGAAILGQRRPLFGREDALGQARTIEALYRSAASGLPVDLGA